MCLRVPSVKAEWAEKCSSNIYEKKEHLSRQKLFQNCRKTFKIYGVRKYASRGQEKYALRGYFVNKMINRLCLWENHLELSIYE